jgi:hypothetical protein
MARNPLHRSPIAVNYLGAQNRACDGLIRRLYVQLWEGRRRRHYPVGWLCSGCGAVKVDRAQVQGLVTVPTTAGGSAVQPKGGW